MQWLYDNWIGLFSLFFTALTWYMTFIRKGPSATAPIQHYEETSYPQGAPDSIEFNHEMKVWTVIGANVLQVSCAVIFFFTITNSPEAKNDPSRVGYAILVAFCSALLYKRLSLWLKYNRKKYK